MKRRPDGREVAEKYVFEIPFISDFYFTTS
jgi:hypothetical protein